MKGKEESVVEWNGNEREWEKKIGTEWNRKERTETESNVGAE